MPASEEKATPQYKLEPRVSSKNVNDTTETAMAVLAYRKVLRHIEKSIKQPDQHSIRYEVENDQLIAYLISAGSNPVKINIVNIFLHLNARFGTVLKGMDWNEDCLKLALLQKKLATEPEYSVGIRSDAELASDQIELDIVEEGYRYRVVGFDKSINTGIIPWPELEDMPRTLEGIDNVFKEGEKAYKETRGKHYLTWSDSQRNDIRKQDGLKSKVKDFAINEGHAKKCIQKWYYSSPNDPITSEEFLKFTGGFWTGNDNYSLLNDFIWYLPSRAHQHLSQPHNISLLILMPIALTKYLEITKAEWQAKEGLQQYSVKRAEGEFNEGYKIGDIIGHFFQMSHLKLQKLTLLKKRRKNPVL